MFKTTRVKLWYCWFEIRSFYGRIMIPCSNDWCSFNPTSNSMSIYYFLFKDVQLDDGLEISLLNLKQDWEEKFGQQQKCASGTSACSSMKMWPVVITKQCKSKHCTAWEHISPNVQKECHLIPDNLVSEWQSKINCCVALKHQGDRTVYRTLHRLWARI